jgi:uncharacterized protein YqiB (DUF1249 family)
MLLELDSVRTGSAIEPHSFSGLMDLYEQNYIRLRKIAPDLTVADQMISSVPGHTDLYLSVNVPLGHGMRHLYTKSIVTNIFNILIAAHSHWQ